MGRLERQLRALTMIPGSSEHGYATVPVTEETGDGAARILNRNTLTAATDWTAALDELQATCPNVRTVALVVSWFGTDLRAGRVSGSAGRRDRKPKRRKPALEVAGLLREEAHS